MAFLPPVPYWQPALGLLGQVATDMDDIDQCIRVILGTTKGDLPLDPEFGIAMDRYLDAPQGMASVALIREITAAIQKYEPRVKVLGVGVTAASIGQTTITVKWMPLDAAQAQGTGTQATSYPVGGSN